MWTVECGVQVLGVVSGDKKVKMLIFSKKGGTNKII